MQSNDELATALERAACILQFHFPGSEAPIREAARRLREVEAEKALHDECCAQADAAYVEVERLRAEVDAAINERDDARERMGIALAACATFRDGWHDAESIAAIVMERGLAECERGRAANEDLLRRIRTLMDACDARDARLARAEAVITEARSMRANADSWKQSSRNFDAALAAWDEENRNDG